MKRVWKKMQALGWDGPCEPLARNSEGLLPLPFVIRKGWPPGVDLPETERASLRQVVSSLIKEKAPLDDEQRSLWDMSPLILAIHERDVALCELLLKAGANPNGRLSDKHHPLLHALEGDEEDLRDVQIVKLLLDHGADPATSYGPHDDTALMRAAVFSPKALRLLLEHGVEVDDAGPFNSTALHRAAEAGKEEAIVVLLLAGANRNAKNQDGETPKLAALRCNHGDAWRRATQTVDLQKQMEQDLRRPRIRHKRQRL